MRLFLKRKEKILQLITDKLTNDEQLSPYFLISGEITNSAYNKQDEKILVFR